MSDLSSIERRKLEKLFCMGGGYVLDFSDRTFSEFFEENTRIDIDAATYRERGTTFAEISKQNFRPIRVVPPPKELMAVFTAKVAPLYAQITANLQQSRTLATLRDTLLPKLLSGEVTLNEN